MLNDTFFGDERILVQPAWQAQRPFLEHEHRNVVLAHIVDEMRSRRLIKIGHPASQQRELGVLEFRQIEREGDLSLEPGLHRVPIRGDHVHRR